MMMMMMMLIMVMKDVELLGLETTFLRLNFLKISPFVNWAYLILILAPTWFVCFDPACYYH